MDKLKNKHSQHSLCQPISTHPTTKVPTALVLPFIPAKAFPVSINHGYKYSISEAEAQEYGFKFGQKPFKRHF